MKRLGCIILFAMMSGCSSSVSIDEWQNNFEAYLANHESGDPSFLRDPTGSSRHARFAVLGGLSPDKSTDVSGAVVGRPTVQGRPWLVFIVASVNERNVQDIRVAMASDDGGAREWTWSEENPASLATYKGYHASRWKRFDPVREQPPITPGLFPPDEDLYRFEIAGNTAWVTELNSGARWTIVLPNRG